MVSPSRSTLAEPVILAQRARNKWIVLALVCMAEFMVVLDATVITVALPSIQRGLHFSTANLQWIVNAYALTFGGFLLLGGRLGDLFGRQRVFLVGLVLFTGASILDGFASSPAMLVIGRGIQGLGGALITPTALAIIVSTFGKGGERNQALGLWSGIVASGGAFGLLVGGALTQAISWRWAFFINGPIGVLVVLLAVRLIIDSKAREARGVDILGASAVTAGLIAVTYALVTEAQPTSHGGPTDWTSARVLVYGGIGMVLLIAFVLVEARSLSPLVPLSIFRIRSVASANLAMFLVASGSTAMLYFMTLYMQHILKYSPFQAGLGFLPFTLAVGMGAGASSQLVKRVDARIVASFGLVLGAGGLLWLTQTSVTSNYWTALLGPTVVMSVGVALAFVPLTLIATSHAGAGDAGLASGLLQTAQRVGGSLGLAVLVTISSSHASAYLGDHPADPAGALISGFHAGYAGGGVFLMAAAVVVVLLIRRSDVASLGPMNTEVMVGVSDGDALDEHQPMRPA